MKTLLLLSILTFFSLNSWGKTCTKSITAKEISSDFELQVLSAIGEEKYKQIYPQINIIHEAHLIGENELGKDGTAAGIENYTAAQTNRKLHLLKRITLLTQKERRALFEQMVVGKVLIQPRKPIIFSSFHWFTNTNELSLFISNIRKKYGLTKQQNISIRQESYTGWLYDNQVQITVTISNDVASGIFTSLGNEIVSRIRSGDNKF